MTIRLTTPISAWPPAHTEASSVVIQLAPCATIWSTPLAASWAPKYCPRPGFEEAVSERPQPHEVRRQLFNESRQLGDEDRPDDHHEQGNDQHGHEHDADRRPEPVHAATFQHVGDRIEKVGERHAKNERQQDAAEYPEKQGG
jgi:hypothetical protein